MMMKLLGLFLSGLISSCVTANRPSEDESIVDRQYDAYRKKDLERFLSFYADDAILCAIPSNRCLNGKEEIRANFSKLFANAESIDVHISNRTIDQKYIIDRENAKIKMPGKFLDFLGLSVYRMEAGKIASLHTFMLREEIKE